MSSWSSTPTEGPTGQDLRDALLAADQRDCAPDGAGLGLACGCLIVVAVVSLLVIGAIIGAEVLR